MTVERALKEASISVEVREYPLMYKETEVFVDTSKHDEEVRANERRKLVEWLVKHSMICDCFGVDLADTCGIEKAVELVLDEYERENK